MKSILATEDCLGLIKILIISDDFQEKEKEFDLLQQEGEITKLELHNSRLFIILIVVGAFLLIGGFNLAYLSKKKIIKNRKRPLPGTSL